jgi:integrase
MVGDLNRPHFLRKDDLHWNGQRIRIFSDKQGEVLDSYQRALNIQAKINVEMDENVFDPSRYLVADQAKFVFDNLIKRWVTEKEREAQKGNLASSYVDKIKIYVENYILPHFKGKDARDLRTIDIKEFYRQMPERLSPKYSKNILNAFENFFNTLIEDEIIEKKPTFPSISVPERPTVWCTRETQDKIINFIPERHRPIFFFLTRQGLRPAEAAVIKWGDIDLANGILTVRRTLSNRRVAERTKGKTVRPRLLHPGVLQIIRSLPRGLPNVFLFLNPNNRRPYQIYTLERIWNKACEEIGVGITLYGATRHSVASMAASSGVSINIIKEVLGHSDFRTTMRYSHLDVLAQNQVFMAQNRHQTVTSGEVNEKKILKFSTLD